MHYSRNGPVFLLGILICFVIADGQHTRKYRVRPYKAKIMDRPDDVDVVKCGDDIRLTCIAEGEPTPDIEWWFQNQDQEDGQNGALVKAAREGRVKIKTEKLFVIRSTLIIHNAGEADEGMYQCRASNSPKRNHKNINLLQHWKIEEVPVSKVMCGDTALSHTEVYPVSNFSESIVSKDTERALASLGLTSSTESTTTTIAASDDKGLNSEVPGMKTSHMTSSTTVVTVKPVHHGKPGDSSVNSIEKPKKGQKRKTTKTVIERESPDHEEVVQADMSDGVRASGTTTEDDGDRNSASEIHRSFSTMTLLQVAFASSVLLTSSC